MLESFSERTRTVRRFLEMFKPGLVYDIVPLYDVCGPTAADPNIQALVVSLETASGGKAGTCFIPFSSRCAHVHGVLKWTKAGKKRASRHYGHS